jgi:isoleucyl-tRNA synthetase
MYTFKSDSAERRSGQTAMFELLTALLKMAAPLLAMTTDEAWGYLKRQKKAGSVHLADWPEDHHEKWFDEALNKKWGSLIRIREDVLRSLEDARAAGSIGSSLEAMVAITAGSEDQGRLLNDNRDLLRYLFIVSQVELAGGGSPDGVMKINVEKARGKKCQRCWNYSEFVGRDSEHPALCERCVKSIK